MIIYRDTDAITLCINVSNREIAMCKTKSEFEKLSQQKAKEILSDMEKYRAERIKEQLNRPHEAFCIRRK